MAFLMPIAAATTEEPENEAGAYGTTNIDFIQQSFGETNLKDLGKDIVSLACDVDIIDINLKSMMPVGIYEICVELDLLGGTCPPACDVKLFLDVYKESPLPNEEMYCTDFEDVADIYNNWESIDGPSGDGSSPGGGIDTFTWSNKRSHSPTYSMRCTQFDDHYLGNQVDYLTTHVENPLDTVGTPMYDEMEIQFFHWMEGEEVDNGDGTFTPYDWGIFEYSFNNVDWLTVPCFQVSDWDAMLGADMGQIWTDTEDENPNSGTYEQIIWLRETGNITTAGETDVYFRFHWETGPTIQNEGWYIDDFCVYGRQSPHPEFLFQTHSLGPFTIDSPPQEYCFPKSWIAEEGSYLFEIWMLSETGGCDVIYDQPNKFPFRVEVGDYIDLSIIKNLILGGTILPPPAFGPRYDPGDNLHVEAEVTNEGTINAVDVPLTMSIYPVIDEYIIVDYVEGANYIVDGPDKWDPYADEAFEEGAVYAAHDFGAASQSLWHIQKDFSFVSPSHTWYCADDTYHYPAGIDDVLGINLQTLGLETEEDWEEFADTEKTIAFDMTYYITHDLNTNDNVRPNFIIGSTWITLSSSQYNGNLGWRQESFENWVDNYYNPARGYDLASLTLWLAGAFGLSVDDGVLWGWNLEGLTGNADTNGDLGGDWSGVMIDNINILRSRKGDVPVHETTIIIDELKAETITTPAEVVALDYTDGLVWNDMPTGKWVEQKEVPLDHPNKFKPINDLNLVSDQIFHVLDEITCYDESDMEHYDMTGEGESHWMIGNSGYDGYLWCGDEAIGTYDDEWNDVVALLSPDNSAHPKCDISMDFSGNNKIFLQMDAWADIALGDRGIIEVNPAVSEPGSQWWAFDPAAYYVEDFEGGIGGTWTQSVPPWVVNPYGFFPGWGEPQPQGLVQYAHASWALAGHVNGAYELISQKFNMNGMEAVEVSFGHAGNTGWGWAWGDDWTDFSTMYVYSGGMTPADRVMALDLAGNGASTTFMINPSEMPSPAKMYFGFEYFFQDLTGPPVAWDSWLNIDDLELKLTVGQGTHDWMAFEQRLKTEDFFDQFGYRLKDEIGNLFTDDMGVRFRFNSNAQVHHRGWLLDDIAIMDSTKTDFLWGLDTDADDIPDAPEPCEDMSNFVIDLVKSGDYWFEDTVFGGYTCQKVHAGVIPNDVECSLVWKASVPQATYAELEFFNAYDLKVTADQQDYCYLEFSTDGGNTWVAPLVFSGADAGSGQKVDMTTFAGEDILIRWRVNTDDADLSVFYSVKDMCVYGFVDTVAPVSVGTLSGTVAYGWYSSPVTFTCTASDDLSGVDEIYYKIDGGSTLTYSAPITISANGEHYIEYWAVDNVGNEELPHHTTATFKIDTGSAPSVAITAPTEGLYLFGNKLLSLSGKIIIIGGFTVEATASDADSGIYSVAFDLDGTTFGEDTTSPYSAYCGAKHTGAGTVTATAKDLTDQTASASISVTYFKFL
jgi:hypothetical protein